MMTPQNPPQEESSSSPTIVYFLFNQTPGQGGGGVSGWEIWLSSAHFVEFYCSKLSQIHLNATLCLELTACDRSFHLLSGFLSIRQGVGGRSTCYPPIRKVQSKRLTNLLKLTEPVSVAFDPPGAQVS